MTQNLEEWQQNIDHQIGLRNGMDDGIWLNRDDSSKNPQILTTPRSDSLWRMNWKVLMLNGHQLRALVDRRALANCKLKKSQIIPGYDSCRTP